MPKTEFNIRNQRSQVFRHFRRASRPIFQIASNGTVTYLHHDHLGSVIAQANASGVVGNKYKYSPWGESPSLTGTTIGYTGQRWDTEAGLYHYQARYYRPSTGRFLQTDPVGYKQDLNLYTYCVNDPMNHTDPLGLFDFSINGEFGVFGPGIGNFATHRQSTLDWLAQSHSHSENVLAAGSIIPWGHLAGEIVERANLISANRAVTRYAQEIGGTVYRGPAAPRLARDAAVNPQAPLPSTTGNTSRSSSQNARAASDLQRARDACRASNVRVNQHQTNLSGNRVGIGRPDHQMTFGNRVRVNAEYDIPSSTRGAGHARRIRANDPTSIVILVTAP